MRYILTGIIVSLSLCGLAAQEHFIAHNGYNRAYLLYVPSNYDSSEPYSLIIALHSSSGTDSSLYRSGFNDRAEIMKYIVAYPSGLNRTWNGPDDDVDFISVLIDTIESKYNINPERIYATGQSAGAFFSYRLGCELSNRIAAIAPLAGSSAGYLNSTPMPVCAIHAVDDALVSFSAAKSSLSSWRNINQCSGMPDTVFNLYGVVGELWKANETGADIIFYTYSHGGHSWLNSPVNCVDFIVGFFYLHPKRKINVTLSSPISTIFEAPGTIDLTVIVESDVQVSKVEYFAGSIKIGESSVAPYLVNWNDVVSGVYLVYAKATVADGRSEISSNIKEIQVMSENLALQKPFECSGNESSLYTAQNAFDGDFSTRWSTPFSDPQWILVDLQEVYRINSVTLFWETACGLAYTIDISSDNQNWATVYTTTAGRGGTEYIPFVPVDARYVRMYGTQRATPYGYSLWEFQVHGTDITSVSDLKSFNSQFNITASPNPFNSETTIHYSVPEDGPVELSIYSISGQVVRTLIRSEKKAGEHFTRWNGCDDYGNSVSSGVYLYRLTANHKAISGKLIYLK